MAFMVMSAQINFGDCNLYPYKIKEPLNVTKVQSLVILVLYNVRMVPSNVRKKKQSKETKVQ